MRALATTKVPVMTRTVVGRINPKLASDQERLEKTRKGRARPGGGGIQNGWQNSLTM
jgi:hypothetical protein